MQANQLNSSLNVLQCNLKFGIHAIYQIQMTMLFLCLTCLATVNPSAH